MFRRKKAESSENRSFDALDFSPERAEDFENQVVSWRTKLTESSKVRDFDASNSKFFSEVALAELRNARRERSAQKRAAKVSKSTPRAKKSS